MSSGVTNKYGNMIQEFAARVELFHEEVARQLGLNATDLKCAGLIRRSGPLTGIELAKGMGLTGAAITKIVDKLEKLGFVRREKHTNDRRFMTIHSVPEAQQRVAQLYESFANSMGKLFESYNKQELESIFDFIHQTTEILIEETMKMGVH